MAGITMSKKKLKKMRPNFKDDKSIILPSDIIFCILIKVFVPSLLRFKSVSKSWNAIICDKKFTEAHRDQSKALECKKFLLQRKTVEFELIHVDQSKALECKKFLLQRKTGEFELIHVENPKIIMEKQQFPIKKFHNACVLCSHDGLVLLKKPVAYKKFVLWNPSSGQHHTLACPYRKPYDHRPVHGCGLCYDSTIDDYKVILIYSLFYAVYSTSTDSWTKKTNLPILEQRLPRFDSEPYSRSCIQGITTEEGCVYWSLDKKLDEYVREVSTIIYFDVKSDELKELHPTPDFVGEDKLFSMSTLKGCLSLCGGDKYSYELDIWILEQQGWKWLEKLRKECLPSGGYNFITAMKLLCCTRNGELIFHGPGHHNLSIYNPKQRKLVITTYVSNNLEYVYCRVDPTCLDSLYFPTVNAKHNV